MCEFIAISAGSVVVPEDYSDWCLSFKEFCYIKNGKGEVVEFYNVLWIQRKSDIAYRHGIGGILKVTWNSKPRKLLTSRLADPNQPTESSQSWQ